MRRLLLPLFAVLLLSLSASKAHAELAWGPRQTLDSGLERTVAWYLQNRAWCETVQKGRYDRQRLGLTAGEEGST